MIKTKVFENNKTQAIRLPVPVRFSASVKQVTIRTVGPDRVISPVEQSWDSFFLSPENTVTEDFLPERAEQIETPKESLDD
ncbi:MAG: type II toxin-antitoxin system VapB family antitoxin [Gammaproteobacteria bacterium]|nr:type II toxin-antitoxin system VapB family antitoxin [Gammaproteobacteria bacterium]MDZ7750198.1 type II toxin-antitoxin system VapB family antitoxin [Gammaproteobacteria bacterium]